MRVVRTAAALCGASSGQFLGLKLFFGEGSIAENRHQQGRTGVVIGNQRAEFEEQQSGVAGFTGHTKAPEVGLDAGQLP